MGFVTFRDDTSPNAVLRRDGDCSGQSLAIDNCQNSLLLILSNLTSVIVDDCSNCVIILGPCQGSVFIRDSTSCTIFAACQQLRTRNSNIKVYLYASTSPIIEDTIAEIWPLAIQYPCFEEQMERAQLAGTSNLYAGVQDFTPDISQLCVYDTWATPDFKNALPDVDIDLILSKEQVTFPI